MLGPPRGVQASAPVVASRVPVLVEPSVTEMSLTMSEHDVDELQPYERASNMPRELHRSLDPSARMQARVDLAVTLIQGCDHAGLTIVEAGQITCGPGSDEVVARVDAIQHELGEGPCVDPSRLEDRTIYVEDLTRSSRWPRWAERVTGELGVGSLLSLLLYTHEGSSGALNLYATQGQPIHHR